MLRNYLIVAYRNLMRHKVYSLINVAGLSIGIAFCILAFLYVRREWAYDTFHKNADRIYRANFVDHTGAISYTPDALGPALEDAFPNIRTVRIGWGASSVKYQDRAIPGPFAFADPAILEVFTFPLLRGNPETVFKDPYSLIVTEAAAKRYFGGEDPLGKVISVEISGRSPVVRDFVIAGIAETIPKNSSIRFDFLAPIASKGEPRGRSMSFSQTFVLLSKNNRPAEVEHRSSKLLAAKRGERWNESIALQPLLEMHLNQSDRGPKGAGNPALSYILLGIALLVLTIACVNFITIAVGRSFSRNREVAMRKVAGASRIQLRMQFLGESMLLSLMALIAGVGLAQLLLPAFNSVVVKDLALSDHVDGAGLAFLIGIVIIVGLAAGGYPAFVLSVVQPATALKGSIRRGGSNRFGRALVVLQFVLSVSLVVTALLMVKQFGFLRTKPLGFDIEHLVRISAFDTLMQPGSRLNEVYRNELSGHPMIVGVTTTSHTLNNRARHSEIVEHDEKKIDVEHINVGHDFMETMGVSLLEGADFDQRKPGSLRNIIINEALVRRLGWKRPIAGRMLRGKNRNFTVIGVVQDFHFRSLHHKIGPLVLSFIPRASNQVFVRIRPENVPGTLAFLEDKWREVAPGREFGYWFFDDELDGQYRKEKQLSRILGYATLLAVFIACLGAFGLTALAVARRTREIGIRKVLGARASGIVSLLSRDFVMLVVIASFIAFPVAYYATERWLRDFAYRIDPQVSTFALGGGIVLVAVLLTVSVQAIRAAWANPVDALRTE